MASSFSRRGARQPSTVNVNETTDQVELTDVLLRLHAHVVASGGLISSTDIGRFYSSSADGPVCKEAFKKAGGLKKALTRTDKLVYVTSAQNPLLGTIETLPSLADGLQRLHAHVVASGGSISSSTGIGRFYSTAGSVFRQVFQDAGGLKKALARTDKLVYVTSEHNPDLGTIEVRGSDAALPPPPPQQQQRPAANPKPDSSQKQRRPSTNPPPTLPLNSFGLPLRPDAKACPQWLKYRRCDFRVKCKYDHPDVEETPTDGVIFRTSMDKKGCSIGWIVLVEALEEALPTGDEQAPGSEAFFFHGQRASGFKASGTGALQSAGLELIKGDRVAELVLKKKGEKGYTVVAGSLMHCARRGQQAFADYLDGLLAVLKDDELCETALHSLGQCIQVSETFLKLGYISDAKKALGLAKQRGLDEAVEENWKRVDSLEKLQQKVDDFCSCVDVVNARSLLHDAIDALTELEGMAVRWRSSGSLGVPAAAACCVLVQDWASQIIDAGTGLSEGRRRLLQRISNSSRTHLKELRALNGVTFSSIDRYQGSENDVVIISLVRSNADCKVGFLQEPARRVVAQSRARLGMYFIGDGETFESSKHWSQLTANLQGRGRRGASIPLCCPVHTSCVREISCEDADSVIQCGVCQQPCGQLMSCGVHTCTRRCHGTGGGGIDNLHMICTEPVADAKCAKGHTIKRRCFQATEDVVCPTCARIEKEEGEKAERERREMEERAARECEQILSEVRKMPPQLQKHDLQKHGADAVEYMQVVDRAERYAQSDHGSAIVVSRIEKVTNPLLEEKFLAAKLRLKSGVLEPKMQPLFHGTGAEGVEGIPKTGFRLPAWSEDNMFGRAVYFATDSSKSFQQMYTKGSGCLLLCDVLLGNSCQIAGLESRHPLSRHVKKSSKGRPFLDMSKRQLRDAGFDSVYASRGSRDKAGVQYDEMMVYDTDQAIPRYILHIGGCGQWNLEWQAPLQRLNNGATVRKIKEADVGVTDSKELEEFNKAVGQYMRLMGPGSRKVTQVDVYESPMIEKAFQDKEASFRAKKIDTKKIWVFHGTAEANIEPICVGGFRVAHGDQIKNGAAHGHGVYTAKGPQTPMGYADGCGAVIMSLALPGTTGQQGQADSWTPRGDWMIFKTGEQLCPKYVVRYT